MKKILFSLLLIVASVFNADAQWINQFIIDPLHPTPTDTIRMYVSLSFQSGSCDQKSQFLSDGGTEIYANASHCLGMLSYICSTVDTFVINPRPTGSYTFHLQVNAGAGPFPCTPGIVAGPNDSVTFLVTQATGLPEYMNELFSVSPNPTSNYITVQLKNVTATNINRIQIVGIDGKVVLEQKITGEKTDVDVSELASGIYLVVIKDDVEVFMNKFVRQ